jgi:hypothetical protein
MGTMLVSTLAEKGLVRWDFDHCEEEVRPTRYELARMLYFYRTMITQASSALNFSWRPF